MPVYVGLMSGTSADGIDAVLVDLDEGSVRRQIAHTFTPYPHQLQREITELYSPGNNEIDRLGALDIKLGELFAKACLQLIEKSGVSAADIIAIGSHGQTIRHRPRTSEPFTLQIGDPNVIAARTGIATVADFRRRDIALGGQGAPLAPAFHHAMFAKQSPNCGVLNLGGIANISVIQNGELICGYDIAPANGLLDYWVNKHLGKAYDDNGHWASTGSCCQTLLDQLLAHPYFTLSPPRSTGREEFSGQWLEDTLKTYSELSPEDVQNTLLHFSVQSIIRDLTQWKMDTVYVCGGGVFNQNLMTQLRLGTPQIQWQSTAELGVEPDLVEATAFAWLAHMTINRLPGNNPRVTGANKPSLLGAIYWGS